MDEGSSQEIGTGSGVLSTRYLGSEASLDLPDAPFTPIYDKNWFDSDFREKDDFMAELDALLAKLKKENVDEAQAEPDVDAEPVNGFEQLRMRLEDKLRKRVTSPDHSDPSKTVAEVAVAERTERFRNPQFQSLLRLLAKGVNPDMKRRIAETLSHADEMIPDDDAFKRFRIHAPLLAALWRDPEARVYLEQMMDGLVHNESDRYKEEIGLYDGVYVPVVISGSGPIGTAIGNMISGAFPGVQFLTLEAQSFTGGKFAEPDADAYTMNTPNLVKDNPNSLGQLSLLETFHVSGSYFPNNQEMAGITKVDSYFAGPTLVDAQISRVTKTGKESGGAIKIEFFDPKTKRTYILFTDVFINTGGFGESSYGVKEKGETAEILARSKKEYSEGKIPRVMTIDQFNSIQGRVAKGELPHDYLASKDVLVYGGGHGAAIGAEGMLSQRGNSSQRYVTDRPAHIDWANLKFKTRGEFVAGMGASGRYDNLAAELPKKEGDTNTIIAPIPDVHVIGFKQDEANPDRTIAVFQRKDGSTFEKSYDVIVSASGYENKNRAIYADLPTEVYSDYVYEIDENEIKRAFSTVGSTIYYRDSPFYRMDIEKITYTGINSSIVEALIYSNDRTVYREEIVINPQDPYRDSAYRYYFGSPNRIDLINFRTETDVIANDGIVLGKKIEGLDIYNLGVGSGVTTVSEAEQEWIDSRSHNSAPAALAINVPKATLAAFEVLERIGGRQIETSHVRLEPVPPEASTLPPFDYDRSRASNTFRMTVEPKAVPKGVKLDTLTRLGVEQACSSFKFPEGTPDLTARIEVVGGDEDEARLSITVSPAPPVDSPYMRMVYDIIRGDLVQACVCEQAKHTPGNTVELKLPLHATQ